MFIFYGRFLYTQRLKDAHHKSWKKWRRLKKSSPFYCSDRKLSDLLMYFTILFVRFIPTRILEMCAEFDVWASTLLSISSSLSSLFNFDTFRIFFCWRVSVCARLYVMNVLAKRIKKIKTATKKVCNNKILKKLQKLFLRQMFFAPVEIFSVLCVKWPCQQTKSVCVWKRKMQKMKLKEWVQKKREKNVITKRLLKLLKYLVTIQNENRMSRL